MKTTNQKTERVEVMALFGYEMTPCEPLSFRRQSDAKEIEVQELLSSSIKFVGADVIHLFDVKALGKKLRLAFNAKTLAWSLIA